MRIASAVLMAFVLAALVAGGCSRRPSMVPGKEKMAQLLADIHEGEGMADQNFTQYRSDSSRLALRQAIYAKHGVNQEIMDSALAWYGYNVTEYMEVYDRVIEILEGRMNALPVEVSAVVSNEIEGDTAIVWRSEMPQLFTPRINRNIIAAELKHDRFWESGDTYTLNFKTVDTRGTVDVSVTALYTDGSNQSVSRSFSVPGWQSVKLRTDTANSATAVLVNIFYDVPEHGNYIAAIDSITLMRTHRRTPRSNR